MILPTGKKDAIEVLKKKKFDAVIISYSISTASAVEMTELFKENNPSSPIIAITKGEWADLKAEADASVNADDGPDVLIDTIRSWISRKKMRIIKRQ